MSAPADEAWKIMICAEEAKRAKEALATLTYILADGQPGHPSFGEMLDSLKGRTGFDIATSVERYVASRIDSVQAAITKD